MKVEVSVSKPNLIPARLMKVGDIGIVRTFASEYLGAVLLRTFNQFVDLKSPRSTWTVDCSSYPEGWTVDCNVYPEVEVEILPPGTQVTLTIE
jgi:hypothetical protein